MDGTAKLHVPTQIVLEINVTLWTEGVMMDVKTKSGLMMVERNVYKDETQEHGTRVQTSDVKITQWQPVKRVY